MASTYMPGPVQASYIRCCMCGIAIPTNPANMCVNCIRNQVDITEGIQKQLVIQFCKACGSYLQPPTHWHYAELESRELLGMCLKRIRGLNKVKLIDANWVWTEPHSRRLKIKLTIQKEVFNGTILQQMFIVEYVVQTQMCPSCHRLEAKDTWNAVAQVRQRVSHKRTFFFLEQLILKHNAHENALSIKEEPDGIDFYFVSRSHCSKFVDYLQSVVPLRYGTSKKLVSHDDRNNSFNYKYTFSVEIVPICKDDLICLPPRLAALCGYISPVVICHKVSNLLHVVDPNTIQTTSIPASVYFQHPFRPLASSQNMVEFIIIDVNYAGANAGKLSLAHVTCARSRDFGIGNNMFVTRTHLGYLLKPGDTVMGYDLTTANYNDENLAALKMQLPDVILVKKVYPNRRRRPRNRHWKLKTLEKEEAETTDRPRDLAMRENDYEQFLQDLEEDKEMRSQINLYKTDRAEELLKRANTDAMVDEGEDDEVDFPEVGLEELMEELTLNDRGGEGEGEGEGEDMAAA